MKQIIIFILLCLNILDGSAQTTGKIQCRFSLHAGDFDIKDKITTRTNDKDVTTAFENGGLHFGYSVELFYAREKFNFGFVYSKDAQHIGDDLNGLYFRNIADRTGISIEYNLVSQPDFIYVVGTTPHLLHAGVADQNEENYMSDPHLRQEWQGFGAKVYTGLVAFVFAPGFGVHLNAGYTYDKMKLVKSASGTTIYPSKATGVFSGYEINAGLTFRIVRKQTRTS